MNLKNIYIHHLFTLLLIMQISSGCDAFLSAEPNDRILEEDYWESEEDVSKFLTDIYSTTFPIVNEGSIYFDEALSDNAYMTWDGWYTDVKLVANGTQDSYGTFPYRIWKNHYANIRKCYQLYKNIENVKTLSKQTKIFI